MGNQLCETVKNQAQYSGRNNAILCNIPQKQIEDEFSIKQQQPQPQSQQQLQKQNQKQKLFHKGSLTSSPQKSDRTMFLNLDQEVAIKYQNNIIKCKRKCISYLKSSQNSQKIPIPLLNGFVKVYKVFHLGKQKQKLIYEGQMRKSKFDGFGKLYKDGNIIYEGQFKNNLFDGWGIAPEYFGEFREGKYDGYGVYWQYLQEQEKKKDNKQLAVQAKNNNSNNNIPFNSPSNQSAFINPNSNNNKSLQTRKIKFYYEGYFQNGLYSGSGVLIKGVKWPYKQIRQIHERSNIFDYLNEQIQHEIRLITEYGAKEIYIGQFSNGYKHGFGRLFNDKLQFSGQFSHNLYHGLGTIYNKTNQGKKVKQAVFKMGKQVQA